MFFADKAFPCAFPKSERRFFATSIILRRDKTNEPWSEKSIFPLCPCRGYSIWGDFVFCAKWKPQACKNVYFWNLELIARELLCVFFLIYIWSFSRIKVYCFYDKNSLKSDKIGRIKNNRLLIKYKKSSTCAIVCRSRIIFEIQTKIENRTYPTLKLNFNNLYSVSDKIRGRHQKAQKETLSSIVSHCRTGSRPNCKLGRKRFEDGFSLTLLMTNDSW